MSSDRDAIFGELPKGTIMYCLHCERTYPHGEYRTASVEMGEDFLQMCPYEDCDGDTVMDSKEWDWVRSNRPEYPENPKRGEVYPLH